MNNKEQNGRIALDVEIHANKITIGDNCTIESGVKICCPDGFEIGECSYIGKNSIINAWRFKAGPYTYFERDVEVGRGGCFGSENSVVEMGKCCFCGPGVIINPAERVTIGDEVGIGAGAAIWTHGAYLSILDGFPAKFAPVTIGSRVWLTGQSQVLPGVTIGDDVVISMMSLVNKDLPPGCLAGGIPVRILKENEYPNYNFPGAPMDPLPSLIEKLCGEYNESARFRSIKTEAYPSEKRVFIEGSVFDFQTCLVAGLPLNDIAEDFRDFVRRRGGIRFLTGTPFHSIPHPFFSRKSLFRGDKC